MGAKASKKSKPSGSEAGKSSRDDVIVEQLKLLIVFDFDHSLVDDNTSTLVIKQTRPDLVSLLGEQEEQNGWLKAVNHILNKMHEEGVKREDIEKALEGTTFSISLKRSLTDLGRTVPDSEFEIISGSNDVFVNKVLENNQMDRLFRKIYTNPASYSPEGKLTIQPYTPPTVPHKCKMCVDNLCKGQVLMNELYPHIGKFDPSESTEEENDPEEESFDKRRYKRVFYVGDGGNDLCPVLKLGDNDVALVREGFPLDKLLKSPRIHDVKCKVVLWKNYDELASNFQQLTNEYRQ